MSPSPEDPLIASLRCTLIDPSLSLSTRYRALFALKHHASAQPGTALTEPALAAIAAAFGDRSALLKHEAAYCLGQTRRATVAAPVLRKVLLDRAEDPMVRHESAEALGALSDEASLGVLRTCRDDDEEERVVRETCEIAVGRIEWEIGQREGMSKEELRKSDFASIDPAPPLAHTASTPPAIPDLQRTLLDTKLPLFQRYRAMFALRDLASPPTLATSVPAVHALAAGFTDPSALFRHEIAFVFGQLSHPASIPALHTALADLGEDAMVRHEAAEALGSLGDEEGVIEMLKGFVQDKVDVVRESVVVALDMAEFEKSGDTEYAVVPGAERPREEIAASA